jgi:hypothetical protein
MVLMQALAKGTGVAEGRIADEELEEIIL